LKKVTIALSDRTAAWTRARAARRNLSVSRFVRDVLQGYVRESRKYEAAMKRFLSHGPFKLSGPPPYPKREELYDRPLLRRRRRSVAR